MHNPLTPKLCPPLTNMHEHLDPFKKVLVEFVWVFSLKRYFEIRFFLSQPEKESEDEKRRLEVSDRETATLVTMKIGNGNL